MEIELEGIKLVLVTKTEDPTKGAVQVRQIKTITTADRRILVEHQVPGLEGNLFQNLGRAPVKISFEGSFHGAGVREDLTRIRQKFKEGTACTFNSDITGMSDVTKVLIEEFRVVENAGEPNKYEYALVLREYREPPPEPVAPPSQNAQAQKWAEQTAEETAATINQIVGKVLDEDGNPKSGLKVKITGDEGEMQVTTDEEGIYRQEDVKPGKYEVMVDEPGYEGILKKVEIAGSTSGGSGGGTGAGTGSGT